ncbi:hypothetical protein GF369_04785 [Candidatus Peregrinibacteria bacterium]|nr:hypothetical protein [Candidatus Peregrinibacteria bacterium]
MSSSETQSMEEKLRLLASLGGSPELLDDAEELQQIEDEQEEIRKKIEQMQRDLSILHVAA